MSQKHIKIVKDLFPFIAALSVFFWVNNIEQQKQMYQNHSTDENIQATSIEAFNANE